MIDEKPAVQPALDKNVTPKYLSEATRVTEFRKGKLNLIFADVGAGKTTYVGNILPQELEYEGAFIFLSPYKSLRRQVIEDELFEPEEEGFREALKGFVTFDTDEINAPNFLLKNKKVVLTAQSFMWLVKKHPEVWNQIGVLVIDEVDHVLFTLPTWSKSAHDPFRKITETISSNLVKTFVIGLTATNKDKLLEKWQHKHNVIKFKEPLRELVPHSITYFNQLYPTINQILTEIKKDKLKTRIVIFTKLVVSGKKLKEYYTQQGYVADLLVSDTAKHYTMTNREAAIKQSIEETGDADFGDILIFNSTLERGVSILNTSFSHVIVNDSNPTTQIQVVGRFRYSGIKAYYLNKKNSPNQKAAIQPTSTIPEQYLNTQLTIPETKELAKLLNFSDDRGRQLGWDTVQKQLAHNYNISSKRINSKGKKITVYTITPHITV